MEQVLTEVAFQSHLMHMEGMHPAKPNVRFSRSQVYKQHVLFHCCKSVTSFVIHLVYMFFMKMFSPTAWCHQVTQQHGITSCSSDHSHNMSVQKIMMQTFHRKTQELGYSELSDIKLTKLFWIQTKAKYISSFHSTAIAMHDSKVQILVCD